MKKWLMIQLWRIQQIASVATLGLTVLNFAMMISKMTEWRDGLLGNAWFSVPLIATIGLAVILFCGKLWDTTYKMWNEQQIVNQERTPFYAEKLSPAGIYSYMVAWIPLMDKTGADSKAFRELIKWNLKSDAHVKMKVEMMLKMTMPETAEQLMREYEV